MATEIYIGNNKADFNGDVNVEYSVSDFSEFNSGANNTSFPIDLPLTPNNKSLLHYSNELSVNEEVVDEGKILVDDTEIIRGKITVLSFSKTIARIIIEKDSWLTTIEQTSIKALDFSSPFS